MIINIQYGTSKSRTFNRLVTKLRIMSQEIVISDLQYDVYTQCWLVTNHM